MLGMQIRLMASKPSVDIGLPRALFISGEESSGNTVLWRRAADICVSRKARKVYGSGC